jgi:hypothetical protein
MPTQASLSSKSSSSSITESILVLRYQNILLDRDLAGLYGVTTKRLKEQVKRYLARFPIDFVFQLTAE